MQGLEVKQCLEAALCDTEVLVEGEGCSFQLNIISDVLAGLPAIKRQQLIYSHLNAWIADGSIHAVTMKFFSRSDWAQRS